MGQGERDALHERERESALLAAALARVADGGALVVVEGPPGIGKTRLIGLARRRARDAGLLPLSARGSELEQRVPFGIVRQLLDPLVLGADPARRAALFDGAAAPAASVFESGGGDGEPDDVLPMLHGLFWLVSNLAREQPLALLFDDAQWSDAPSLHFLAYLAPRLEDVAAATVVATRPVVDAGDPTARARRDRSGGGGPAPAAAQQRSGRRLGG